MHDFCAAQRIAGDGVSVCQKPRRACIDLRGDPRDAAFVAGIKRVTDLAPPCQPGACATGLLASLLWLGPDRWLLSSDTEEPASLRTSLRRALQGVRCAVTDVSQARIVYAAGGASASELLAKGCSLDLHERAFPVGRCAQTLLARVPVLIYRVGQPTVFELHVDRSYAEYVWSWLQAAAAEYVMRQRRAS
jgi:sarcosine oxidase, subunit gamma